MKTLISLMCLLLFILLLNACAFDLVHVKQTPVKLELKSSSNSDFILEKESVFSIGTGYKRRLKAKTMWIFVGSLPQGDVFKSRDQILTIEGSNIYEAYIVVVSDNLVGFYLPAEGTFSPLKKPLNLSIVR